MDKFFLGVIFCVLFGNVDNVFFFRIYLFNKSIMKYSTVASILIKNFL
jgi:hypothetical protein